jgi:hypothetical protein
MKISASELASLLDSGLRRGRFLILPKTGFKGHTRVGLSARLTTGDMEATEEELIYVGFPL